MDFTVKFDDQVTSGAERAAGAVDGLVTATEAANQAFQESDAAQKKAGAATEATTAKVKAQTAAHAKATEAAKASEAQFRAMGASQAKAATRAENQAKAFNPEVYKRQVKAQEELRAAQEKALQQLGMGLSAKEKDEKASAAAAEKEKKRARELAVARTSGQTSAGAARLASTVKAATAAFIALGVASAGVSFATMVIGYQSAARLQMISWKLGQNFRQMFRGVDAKPLERAFLRLTNMFSMSSVFGRGLSGLLTRTFNSFFRGVESGVPIIEAIADGVLLAGLRAENAWLRARTALVPYTSALSAALGKADTMGTISFLVAGAVAVLGAKMALTASIATGRFAVGMLTGVGAALKMGIAAVLTSAKVLSLGVAATGAVAPFLALAAAVGAVVAAADQFAKLSKEWDGDLILRSLGLGGGERDADRFNRQLDEEAAARRTAGKPSLVREVATLPGVDAGGSKAAAALGAATGRALGDGMITGIKAKRAELRAAGAEMPKAVDDGARAAGQIHSPSRLMRKTAGYMGDGAVLGLRDSAPRVQRAAEESLVPSVAGGGRGAGAAQGLMSVSVSIGTLIVGDRPRGRAAIREAFEPAFEELCLQVEIAMGGAPAAAEVS